MSPTISVNFTTDTSDKIFFFGTTYRSGFLSSEGDTKDQWRVPSIGPFDSHFYPTSARFLVVL